MQTELEKMLAGQPYIPSDPALAGMRRAARMRCQALRNPDEQHPDTQEILSSLFATGGDTATVQPPFFCDYGVHTYLGSNVYFNFNCVILDVCKVQIGSNCMFGPAVQIYTASHPLDAIERREHEFGIPVTIGDDVWVGGGAVICPGVQIGSRSVIGAGSVVTRAIPDNVFAAGNPCRVIRPI